MSRTTPAAGSTRESPEVEKKPRDWSGFKLKLKSKPARIFYTVSVIVGGSLGILAEWYFAAWVFVDQIIGRMAIKPIWEPAFTLGFGFAYVLGGVFGNFLIIGGLVVLGFVGFKIYEMGQEIYVSISKGMGERP